jgi:class 3 adenylate cyclase
MVFFNDPVEISDHQLRAVRAAMEIRSEVKKLTGVWKDRGHSLCFGLGLAEGYATIGGIGFQDYLSYTAIGTVTNLAARFCEAAENCDILTSHRFWSRVEGFVSAESRGEITPRGIPYTIQAYSLVALREPADPQ